MSQFINHMISSGMKKYLYIRGFLILVLVFILHTTAMYRGWYAMYYGFDKVMHTLAGIAVGIVIAAFYIKRIAPMNQKQLWWFLLFGVFLIGFGWEVFEYAVQFFIKDVQLAYPIDSLGDLLFDIVGGMIGTTFVVSAKRRYNST